MPMVFLRYMCSRLQVTVLQQMVMMRI